MNNFILAGSPCSGKTSITNDIKKNKLIDINDTVSLDVINNFVLRPYSKLFVEENGISNKDFFATKFDKLEPLDMYKMELINNCEGQLRQMHSSFDELLKNPNDPKFKEITNKLKSENILRTGFFARFLGNKQLENLVEKNKQINNILSQKRDISDTLIIHGPLNRREFIEMVRNKELDIDNKGLMQSHVNKMLSHIDKDLEFNQSINKKCQNIVDINEFPDVNKSNKRDYFSLLMDSTIAEMQNRENKNPELSDFYQKQKETLLSMTVTNMKENSIIDLGGGIGYFYQDKAKDFSDNINKNLNKLENILKKAFNNDVVINVMPSKDKEISKKEYEERVNKRFENIKDDNERNKQIDNLLKDINTFIDSDCHNKLSDITLTQDTDIKEQLNMIVNEKQDIINEKLLSSSNKNTNQLDDKLQEFSKNKDEIAKDDIVKTQDDFSL